MFSTGMDEMRDQLRQQGVASSAIMHTQGNSAAQQIVESPELRNSPVIIIGHSLGADEAVNICRELAASNVTVDLLVTLDPVNAPRVPPNVRRAMNYYRSNGILDLLPLFRGTPLHQDDPRSQLVNLDLNQHEEFVEPSTNHFTIDKNARVQRDIVKHVLAICPSPRQSEAMAAGAKVLPGFTPQSNGSAQVNDSQVH
jgi:hypothetical protein